jgi:hypothetical protein
MKTKLIIITLVALIAAAHAAPACKLAAIISTTYITGRDDNLPANSR